MKNKDFLKKQIDNLNDLFDSPQASERQENNRQLFDELFKLESLHETESSELEEIQFGEQLLRAEDNELTSEELLSIEEKIVQNEEARNYVDDLSKLCKDLKMLFGKEFPEDSMLV